MANYNVDDILAELESKKAGKPYEPAAKKAAKKTEGVKDAVVNFMTLKMTVEFEDGTDEKKVMKEVLKNCKKVEEDCEIYL